MYTSSLRHGPCFVTKYVAIFCQNTSIWHNVFFFKIHVMSNIWPQLNLEQKLYHWMSISVGQFEYFNVPVGERVEKNVTRQTRIWNVHCDIFKTKLATESSYVSSLRRFTAMKYHLPSRTYSYKSTNISKTLLPGTQCFQYGCAIDRCRHQVWDESHVTSRQTHLIGALLQAVRAPWQSHRNSSSFNESFWGVFIICQTWKSLQINI